MRERELGVPAAAEQREHAIARREVGDPGPRRFDGARGLETEDRRFTGRRRVMTLALNSVGAVDARRMHANQDAAGAHGRSFDVAGFQDLGTAEPIEDNCLHVPIPWRARACCGAGAISILYRRPNGLPARISY